jgi:hypothetical protein
MEYAAWVRLTPLARCSRLKADGRIAYLHEEVER